MQRAALVIGVLLALLLGDGVQAQDAARLRDLQVIGHHFAITVGGKRRQLGVKDPTRGRWLILKVAARADGRVLLFSHDFILRYFQDASEDRTTVDAISDCETGNPGEFNYFRTSVEPRLKLSGPRIYFGLAAYIEPGVKEIELWRVGNPTPLRYRIGSKRPLSVFLTTNAASVKLSTLAKALRAAGYYVKTSNGLVEDQMRTVVHYDPKAEPAAREISAQLRSHLGVVPELRERMLLSSHDIVVWVARSSLTSTSAQLRR